MRLVQQGSDTLLQYDVDGSAGRAYGYRTWAILKNTKLSSVTADNFVDALSPDGASVPGQSLSGATVTGGYYDDTIVGSAGTDSLRGDGGNDWIDGRQAKWLAADGGTGDDTILGSDNNDQLDGGYGDGNDSLVGGAGNDTLDAGTGNDTVLGGDGQDLIRISVGGGSGLADGGDGNDTFEISDWIGKNGQLGIVGGAGSDVFKPLSTAGTFTVADFQGGAGGDRIDLSSILATSASLGQFKGGDMVAQGYLRLVQSGADTLVQKDLDGAAGNAYGWTTFAVLKNLKVGQLTGANFFGASSLPSYGNDTIYGSPGDDHLSGFSVGRDSIDGGAGDDTLFGSSDQGSTLVGGAGNDEYWLREDGTVLVEKQGEGIDTVVLNYGATTYYTLPANIENGRMYSSGQLTGSAGNNLLQNDGADATLLGGAGNDTLVGDGKINHLNGGSGDDVYRLLSGVAYLEEAAGGGIDLVETIGTSVGLPDNFENLRYLGTDNFYGRGNALNNRLEGGSGNDTLNGGAGSDTLTGGSGNDFYWVDAVGDVVVEQAGQGTDTVKTSLNSYALTANLENLAYSGKDLFTGTGNALDNVITGGDGGDKLDGGAGNDSLIGGAGNDSLAGGAGDDTLVAGAGKDSIDGGDGIDVLQGLAAFTDYTVKRPDATVTVLTDKAGNVLTVRGVEKFVFAGVEKTLDAVQDNAASAGNDKLHGGDGADTLNGGTGTDTLSGGKGDDTYVIDGADDTLIELKDEGMDTVQVAFTAAASYWLGANVEYARITSAAAVNLNGNELDNVLTGNAAANKLFGGDGNDTLDGGAGADQLLGGGGNDLYLINDSGDVVAEVAYDGWDTVLTSLSSYTLTDNIEVLTYTGAAAFTGTGNGQDNTISGGNGGSKLDGGAGDDLLTGGTTADSLQGGAGNDTLVGGGGKDSIDGGADSDVLRGLGKLADYTVSRPNGVDTVLTDKAGIQITVRNVEKFIFADAEKTLNELQYNIASSGNDSLWGGAGDDKLDGLQGADTMTGGDGADTYVVDNAADFVVEEAYHTGKDLVQVAFTAAGTYQLTNFVENATVTAASAVAVNVVGTWQDNFLAGNAAANALSGGRGNDTLDGGAGADTLAGGEDDDTYYVDNSGDKLIELAPEGRDTVRTVLTSYVLGNNVENLGYAGTGNFVGGGNELNNLVTGGLGNDSLSGAAGADTLNGGGGKDTVDGGADNDVLQLGGKLADYTVSRASATDILLTDKAGNSVSARNVEVFAFADTSKSMYELLFNVTSAYNDTLLGGDGNDALNGLAGADSMVGGKGNDTYVVDNLGDEVVEESGGGIDTVQVALAAAGTFSLISFVEHATVTAGAAVAVNINGNGWDNHIIGNAAANTLNGGGGDDTLDGGAGVDKLIGGDGDDLFVVSDAGDAVTELLDEGHDTVQAMAASYSLSANVEELEYIGNAAFTGAGNVLDNVIRGGNGGAKLDGAAGNDTLYGGNGSDSLLGGTGDDLFAAGSGKDTIDGGAGYDTLEGLGNHADYTVKRPNAVDAVLIDKAGNTLTLRNVEWLAFADGLDVIDNVLVNVPSIGSDMLIGTSGKDQLDGLQGADTMRGLEGDDNYYVDNIGDVVEEEVNGGDDTVLVALATAATYKLDQYVENAIVASSAAINLTGNDDGNRLRGNAAANTLTGGAGYDTLDGGAGSDKLLGGTGDDLYILNDADLVTELLEEGYDSVETTLASYTLTANVEALTYTGKGAFTGTGNALSNLIKGGNNGNKLDGGDGYDDVRGGTGNDSLMGGAGNDVLSGLGGNDTLDGGSGQDTAYMHWVKRDQVTVTRTSATETVLTDHAGNAVTLRDVEEVQFSDWTAKIEDLQFNLPSAGNEHLYGTSANETMNGLGGADTLEGASGNDTYLLTDKATVIIENENEGTDTVRVALTSAGTYVLTDNVEDAVVAGAASVAVNLTGNGLANMLFGNAAANTLTGGDGNDTLDGGAGADKLIGGLGEDVYVVSDAGDVVVEQAGEGFDMVSTTLSSYTLTANVEAVFAFGAGMFTGTGSTLANLMVAGNGGSKLDGGDGDDYLIGGKGNDSLVGGRGDDRFEASLGKDTVDGGAGNNLLALLDDFSNYTVLRVNSTDVQLTHYSGATVLARNVQWFDFAGTTMKLDQVLQNSVSAGGDSIVGTNGNDWLDGGPGRDTMVGGAGDDTYVLSEPGDVVVELPGGGTDSVKLDFSTAGMYTLAANVEYAFVSTTSTVAVNVIGNELNNYMSGNDAANSLSGGIGNDTLNGGGGNDTLIGGSGDDEYSVAESGDVIKESANEGYDTVFVAAASYALAANIEDMVFNGSAAFSGTGNDGNNRLFAGSSSGAMLNGGAGNDTLVGAGGNDKLIGGAGDERIESNGGNDTVDGGTGTDSLFGLNARDSYTVTRTANDTVLTGSDGQILTVRGVEFFYFGADKQSLEQVQDNIASPGNDSLHGTAGADTLDGGTGADTITGLDGDDVYQADNLGDRSVEAENGGHDLIKLGLVAAGTYAMDSFVEDLVVTSAAGIAVNVTGNSQANGITGNAAANKLIGGAGEDVLDGGAGSDTLTGGTDADTFVISSLVGSDTITDFISGTDHIRLDMAALGVGDGGIGASVHGTKGGFGTDEELMLFTQKMVSASTANAAAVIGSATGAYDAGDTALFVVSTSSATTLYRFVSSGKDAVVTASELTALVTLAGTPSTTLGDYLFA
ncbi:Ca2+-binding RTX toxin-like protein [Duganella sp. SG902]|uniref:calcium-binding protein n=1 Tax=Duganella sp. SG902 TaxID=2587016 RepID=UPI0017C0DEB0|nr:calcium-binding protein [Duganella sp. SG902]NVM75844.1 Ca2+-binding RTX toxin-like protein [Duganella sp. SG902]